MKKLLFILLLLLSCGGTVVAQQSQDEQLAMQYYKEKEYDKAVELFEKVHAKKPDSYIYYYYYHALLELERYDDAEKMLKKQVKAYPNVPRYKVDLGFVYERSGENAKAEKLLGWKAEKDLEDMCRDTWRFQKNNPKGYRA